MGRNPQVPLGYSREKRDAALREGQGNHMHEWVRLPDSVGLFSCIDTACLCIAVCPGCLNSLEVALRAREGIAGVTLYWCLVHRRREGVES